LKMPEIACGEQDLPIRHPIIPTGATGRTRSSRPLHRVRATHPEPPAKPESGAVSEERRRERQRLESEAALIPRTKRYEPNVRGAELVKTLFGAVPFWLIPIRAVPRPFCPPPLKNSQI
jgi:hypothetical protein